MQLLENSKIKLRAVEPEDLELLYKWENDPAIWIAGNTRAPYSKFQLKQYISQASNDIYENGTLRLIIVERGGNKAVGTVDLFDLDIHHSRVAMGLYISAEFQGNGYAKSAVELTENYVFAFLKINQLYVQISESNAASRRLFEKNYELNGMLKNWIKTSEGFENIFTYQKFRED